MTDTDDDELPDDARVGTPEFEPEQAAVVARGFKALEAAEVPFLLGGAFAKHAYTGIWRNTKDVDIFLRPADLEQALKTLEDAGFRTEIVYNHWLAKAYSGDYFIDLIFGTGHGQLAVEESWFENARHTDVAGVSVRLIPIEELIVSKVYIAERYRFDGADVVHLILRSRGNIDWQRVIALLGKNWGLLLWYLVLFAYVYPGRVHYLPQSLMAHLFKEMQREWESPPPRESSRGTLLDPFSYAADIQDWGYEDRRKTEALVNDEGAVKRTEDES